jgi:hypothetical protein
MDPRPETDAMTDDELGELGERLAEDATSIGAFLHVIILLNETGMASVSTNMARRDAIEVMRKLITQMTWEIENVEPDEPEGGLTTWSDH